MSDRPPGRRILAETEPAIALSEAAWATIDEELRPWFAAAHRAVLGTRTDRSAAEPTAH